MKVIIWFATFIIGTLLNTLLGYVTGIKAGAFLLYLAEYYVARKLCEKWDERSASLEISEPMTDLPENIVATHDNTKLGISNSVGITDKKAIRFCRHCGFELVAGSAFCSMCGTEIDKESILQ